MVHELLGFFAWSLSFPFGILDWDSNPTAHFVNFLEDISFSGFSVPGNSLCTNDIVISSDSHPPIPRHQS